MGIDAPSLLSNYPNAISGADKMLRQVESFLISFACFNVDGSQFAIRSTLMSSFCARPFFFLHTRALYPTSYATAGVLHKSMASI